jgi:hypothetical protein
MPGLAHAQDRAPQAAPQDVVAEEYAEEEIVVTGEVRERDDSRVVVATEAHQGGNGIVRNAEAEIELR